MRPGDVADVCCAWAVEIGNALADSPIDAPPHRGSLGAGGAGQALFLAYLAAATNDARYADAAERRLAEDAEHAADMRETLFSGAFGLGWTYERLCGRQLAPNEEDVNEATDVLALELLADPAHHWEWELMYGAAGVGVYALERPEPQRQRLLRAVVDKLAALGVRSEAGLEWRTSWDPGAGPNANLLGLAHGAAGLVAFLCDAHAHLDEDRPRIATMIRDSLRAIVATRLPPGEASLFPSIGDRRTASRLGWCYGDLCIAVALARAGNCLHEPAWCEEARAIARHAAQRDVTAAQVVDAGMCHGAFGLAHIFRKLAAAVDDRLLEEAAGRWLEIGLAMKRPGEGVAGVVTFRGQDRTWVADPGLLGGAAGVGLALLSAAGLADDEWDRAFLLGG